MRNRKWKIAAVASVAAVTAGTVAGLAGTAGADPTINTSTTYVDGLKKVTDDFNDHYRELGAPLSDHGENSWGTDTVLMWQSILAAEGYLDSDGIDGYFGENTAAATKAWQADRGIDADAAGTVGHTTWATADNNLVGDDGTIDYRTADGGVVVFTKADSPDDGYRLESVTTAAGNKLVNGNGADHIEHYELTIELVPAE